MHAIRLHEFGPPENLRYEEVDDAKPGPGQARIAVAVTGVHFIDTATRAGKQWGPPLPELPRILGSEVAGVIDALGEDVDIELLGRRVAARLSDGHGGYADIAVTDIDQLHLLPDHVADDVAVAMIGTGRTTIAILDVARLTSEDVVLVTAAAGGIGSLLVQAALGVGAMVIGAAGGPDKADRVRRLGATRSIDYSRPDWRSEAHDALAAQELTVVLDGVGGELGRTALELLGPAGRLILFGGSSGEWTQISTGDLYTYGFSASVAISPRAITRPDGTRALEEEALAAAASGRFVPLVTRFPLAEAAAAHAAIESRGTIGKTVLVP